MGNEKGWTTQEAFQSIYSTIETFNELTKWNKKDYEEYEILLNRLKLSRGDLKAINKIPFDTTKSVGDALEDLVNFIIRKTFFFTVSKNVRTGTNEVDQVIRLSSPGKVAMERFEITKSLLHIEDEIFLGECKNYAESLSVTYVGKFYSLLKQCDCNLGLLFTYKGVSGDESKWSDGHGLMKVLRIVEKYTNNKDFHIIEFSLKDYEAILNGKSFFELLDAKKVALQVAAKHEHFLEETISEQLHSIIDHCKGK